jgi:hypothetical protein
MITELKLNQFIVVGTNAMGLHAGGAAAQAYRDFGALYGCSEGPIGGQSYGIVTLGYQMEKVPVSYLEEQAERLRMTALANPNIQFLLTPVGTGIAGFTKEEVEPIFTALPQNVTKVGW